MVEATTAPSTLLLDVLSSQPSDRLTIRTTLFLPLVLVDEAVAEADVSELSELFERTSLVEQPPAPILPAGGYIPSWKRPPTATAAGERASCAGGE